MRVLIITRPKFPIPPDAAPMLVDAMGAWVGKHTKEKTMDQAWSFAGIPGGGGILNVGSPEELDAIMSEFPFAPFSDIECYILSDLNAGLANFKRVTQQRSGPAKK